MYHFSLKILFVITTLVAPNLVVSGLEAKIMSNQNPSIEISSFKTCGDFARAVYPHAVEASKKIGVDPKVLVAQAAHESNWGKNLPYSKEGHSSFNLFGMTAKASVGTWTTTTEYSNGKRKKVKASFRIYKNFNESFMDYARLISNAKRYKKAVNHAHDPLMYLHALQKGGYATDPSYAKKIYDIFKSPIIQNLG